MTTDAIIVEGLSKRYRIYHNPQSAYKTIRDAITTRVRQNCQQLADRLRKSPVHKPISEPFEDIWALKDINFTLPAGSRLAIIGSNGAGKSTLLKILSRIVEPTEGRVSIRGRVSSLLEIGTGFHPELTGTENIYLNGAILGMSRGEIARKFQQIVEFSELERFLDTPLKRYSSGMQMRLAFAVAAHLDPDILMIDEALAVGDFKFQEKCLKKLNEVGNSGRTVIFVSHDISKVLALCKMGLLIEQGQIKMMGEIGACVSQYLGTAQRNPLFWQGNAGNHAFQAIEARLISHQKESERPYFIRGEKVQFEFTYQVLSQAEDFVMQALVVNEMGIALASRRLDRQDRHYAKATSLGRHQLSLSFDTSMFYQGIYQIVFEVISASGHRIIDTHIRLRFQVLQEASEQSMSVGESGILLGKSWDLKHS